MTYRLTLNGEDLAAHTTTVDADVTRAEDLNAAHVTWSGQPVSGDPAGHRRPTFGEFAVNFLRDRGLEVLPIATCPTAHCPCRDGEPCLPPPFTGDVIAALFPNLIDSPHTRQALTMSVEEIADLLGALAERGLNWVPGEGGPDAECGTLVEGAPEPPDLHVVFDCFRNVWQRDDAHAENDGHLEHPWYDVNGRCESWAGLQRAVGPMTPDGGIAPTTPAGEQ